ncbi:AfsR/SARP family transcriptional regulator [Nocardiopsis oceani]
MRIGVLGPLRVVADGRDTDVGGARLRVLLTRLALGVGDVVPPPALTEALWPYEGPAKPDSALHSLISRLRRALPEPTVLRSEPTGYRLALPADSVDAVRFERLAAQGHRALQAGHREDAADLLRVALGLWRGPPLTDIAHLPFAGAAAARLERVRLRVREDLFAAELGSPEADAGTRVVELEKLVADHPLRERLRELLIATLAADGRQAEALTVHEDYRRLLAEKVGTDPGPRLRELHLRLLRGAPAPGGPPVRRPHNP